MKSKINITIPTPCHENWQTMSVVEKGRFCASCQKNVQDFTTATDRQIIQAYKKDQNLCGRFLNTQLDRDLIVPKEKSTIWLATTSAIISFLALGSQEVNAQKKVKTEQTDKKIITKTNQIESQKITIKGEIRGSEFDKLSGVAIFAKKTNITVFSNEEGEFLIKMIKGDTLSFSKEEYIPSDLSFNEDRGHLNIVLKSPLKTQCLSYTVGEAVSSKGEGIYVRQRTYIGRQLYKIGNWFK